MLIGYAATIQFYRDLKEMEVSLYFESGCRPIDPTMFGRADNTSALGWLAKASTTSVMGQKLLALYSALLQLDEVGINGEHLAGDLNVQGDDISRPDLSLSPFESISQLLHKCPQMRTYKRFLPSPELLRIAASSLLATSPLTQVVLPKALGRFSHDESTIFSLQFL